MNTRSRQEFQKSTKNSNNNMPSFSSTLLDEIYRSIDGNAEEKSTTVDLKKPSKRHGETSSFRRACLVEKWIEKEKDTKRKPTTLMQEFENDVMFFSSTSSSSDSSGGLSSSSDNEFFGSVTKASSSCFSARLKPLRTGPSSDEEKKKKKKKKMETSFINSLYANLKHPISPGGRLTSFINSLFSNAAAANPMKSKNLLQDLNSHKAAAAASASSFSRSCLSNTKDKMRRDGSQRSVVSTVILDHQKSNTYDDEQPHKLQIRPTELKQSNRVVDEVLKGYNGKRVDELLGIRKIHEDEDEDCMSDSSSDLFELDHLSLFGDNRFCEELPVYETTHFHTNPPPTAFIR